MKKFISFLLFFILVFLTLNVYAAEDSSEKPTVNIKYDASSVYTWFSGGLILGDFVGIEENSYLRVTLTLDYDSSLMSRVDIQPMGDWTLVSSADSKNVVLETNNAMPNTQIVNINFWLKPGEDPREETQYAYLKDITVSNNSNLNETYEGFSIPFVYDGVLEVPHLGQDDEENKTSNEQVDSNEIANTNNIVTNNVTQNGQNNSLKSNDSTTATTRLPNTGITRILIISIFILIISSIFFKIKSKDIKY